MRTPDPFPQRKWSKMNYTDNIALAAPVTNLMFEYIFQANSTFDPDTTGGGHQPYGRDTMANLYSYYIVKGCFVDLEFYDTDQDGLIVGYQIQGGALSGASVGSAEERPWTNFTSISNTGNQRRKYRIYIDCAKALGLTQQQYMSDTNQYGAAVGASATQGVYLRLGVCSTLAATITNCKCKVELKMDTLWFTRTTLAQS